jgi:O-antigen/teichoic acid export membrane protein
LIAFLAMITIILGRAAQFLIALVTLRVATTMLSPIEMGKVGMVLTTTAFFAMLLINPVGMFINRRLHTWQAIGKARDYLVCYAGYIAAVAILAALSLYLLVIGGLFEFGITTGWLMTLVSCSLIFNTLNQTAIPSLNLLGNSRRFILLTVATFAASLIAAFIITWTVERSSQFWLLGLILGQAFFALVGTRVLFIQLASSGKSKNTPHITHQHISRLLAFSWPVAIAAGLSWMQAQGYRYVMVNELGFAEFGLFVVGYGLSAGIVGGFESILTTYFQPRLYRDANTLRTEQLVQAWSKYAAAVVPSVILTIAFIVALAPELTLLFLGEGFHSAAQFVVWGALSETARILAGMYGLIAHIHMRTRNLIIPNMVGAVLSLTLCIVLIPRVGAIGVGIALIISGFSIVAMMHLTLIGMFGKDHNLPPLAMPMAGGALLVLCAYCLREILGQQGWYALFTSLGVTGIFFLALQYHFLIRHLSDRNSFGKRI